MKYQDQDITKQKSLNKEFIIIEVQMYLHLEQKNLKTKINKK